MAGPKTKWDYLNEQFAAKPEVRLDGEPVTVQVVRERVTEEPPRKIVVKSVPINPSKGIQEREDAVKRADDRLRDFQDEAVTGTTGRRLTALIKKAQAAVADEQAKLATLEGLRAEMRSVKAKTVGDLPNLSPEQIDTLRPELGIS